MALVVPGFVRATAGDYVVNVTATSENDSTKNAQIKTHATIKPFHGVVLSAVDDLTNESNDMKTDIKYAFTVTNTGNVDDTIKITTELPATTQSGVYFAGSRGFFKSDIDDTFNSTDCHRLSTSCHSHFRRG